MPALGALGSRGGNMETSTSSGETWSKVIIIPVIQGQFRATVYCRCPSHFLLTRPTPPTSTQCLPHKTPIRDQLHPRPKLLPLALAALSGLCVTLAFTSLLLRPRIGDRFALTRGGARTPGCQFTFIRQSFRRLFDGLRLFWDARPRTNLPERI